MSSILGRGTHMQFNELFIHRTHYYPNPAPSWLSSLSRLPSRVPQRQTSLHAHIFLYLHGHGLPLPYLPRSPLLCIESIVLSLYNDEYYVHSTWLLLQCRSCRECTSVVPGQGDGTVCNERNALFGDAGVQYLQLRGRQRGLQMITPSNERESTLAESDYGPESSDFGASL